MGNWKKNLAVGIFITLVLVVDTFLEKKKQKEGEENIKTEVWQSLTKLDWNEAKDSFSLPQPIFTEKITDMEGQKIRVSGFLVPNEIFEAKSSYLILSAYPISQCYFCGGAGIESVMEVYLKRPEKIISAEKVIFEGIFKLNRNDSTHLFYQLKEAELKD